jgi:NADH pyrophosphatase NudC (nudix superfamily)
MKTIDITEKYWFLRSIRCGFSCPDGWLNLIDELCHNIEKELINSSIDEFSVDQVKDKFGGLRFYVSGANEKINELIDMAERKSYKICMSCGTKEDVTYKAWATLCKGCRGERT